MQRGDVYFAFIVVKGNKEEERSEVLLGPDNDIEFLKHFMNIIMKIKKYRGRHSMSHFNAFGMINLQCEIRILNKATCGTNDKNQPG